MLARVLPTEHISLCLGGAVHPELRFFLRENSIPDMEVSHGSKHWDDFIRWVIHESVIVIKRISRITLVIFVDNKCFSIEFYDYACTVYFQTAGVSGFSDDAGSTFT